MKREANLFERSLIYIIPFTVIFAFVLYFITFNEHEQVKSLVLGAITSVVLNFFHVSETQRISETNYKKLKGFTIFSYCFRYIIYGALVAVGTIFCSLDPIFMVFGFLEYPIIMMILSFISVK